MKTIFVYVVAFIVVGVSLLTDQELVLLVTQFVLGIIQLIHAGKISFDWWSYDSTVKWLLRSYWIGVGSVFILSWGIAQGIFSPQFFGLSWFVMPWVLAVYFFGITIYIELKKGHKRSGFLSNLEY